MQKAVDIFEDKLKKVLLKDKTQNPQFLIPMLKSDISNVLKNYMDIKKLDIDFFVEDNNYYLVLKAVSTRLKEIGLIAPYITK